MSPRDSRPSRPIAPPRLGRWLLCRFKLGDRHADIEADLDDLYISRVIARGRFRAACRYWLDVLSVRRLTRPPASPAPRSTWLSGFGGDLIHAARVFRRQGGVVTVAVLGLALAIAVSTPVFAILNAFILRPLRVADPASVVTVHRTVGNPEHAIDGWAYADYLRLRDAARQVRLEGSLEWRAVVSTSLPAPPSDAVRTRFITPGFFDAFNARIRYGRGLEPRDHAADTTPVAVLDHAFWTTRLKGDSSVIGGTLYIGSVPVTIVGVFDPEFGGPFLAGAAPVLVMPLAASALVAPSLGEFRPASASTLSVIGRLVPGSSTETADDELTGLALGLGWVRDGGPGRAQQGVQVESADARITTDAMAVFGIAMTIVGLVLLLASANVANLLLAGSTARAQEIGCRLAMGASRGRIVRQLLTESLCLGLTAGALGLVFSLWSTPLASWLIDLPPSLDLSPDVRVYAFVTLLAVTTGLAAGIVPARHGARGDVLSALKGGGHQASHSRRAAWLRASFVAIQAAASIVLLVLTALFGRALVQASTLDVGFDYDRLVAFSVFPTINRSEALSAADFFDAAEPRLRQLSDVAGVALVEDPPFGTAFHPLGITHEGRRYALLQNKTSPGYFQTIGLPILRGRIYTDEEMRTKAPVAVISAQVARDFWPGEDPIGDTLARVTPSFAKVRVIGVAGEAIERTWPPNYHRAPSIYRPLDNLLFARLIVRMSSAPEIPPRPVEAALRALDPGRQITASLVRDGLRDARRGPAIFASVAAIIGVLALVLAVVGVAGVTAFVVGQRRREIGIRLAIGANRWQVVRGIFGDNMRPVVIGLVIGLALAAGAATVISRALIVSAFDPLSYVLAVVALLGSAAVGVLLPARRAAHVDPAAVLRDS